MGYNDEFELKIGSELKEDFTEETFWGKLDLEMEIEQLDPSYAFSPEDPWEDETEQDIIVANIDDEFDNHEILELENIFEELSELFEEREGTLGDIELEQVNEFQENELRLEENISEPQDIDYDAIYENIRQEALVLGFEGVNIEHDIERLDDVLEDFCVTNWSISSLSEQKNAIESLANYISDSIGFRTTPTICYYYNEKEGEYGGYNSIDNSLDINEYMLYDSKEAADTIAHELWHAYQHERAETPQCARDYQYQFNFENYIGPELGQEAYENQLVEAEARAFAAQFKDRLAWYEGKSE